MHRRSFRPHSPAPSTVKACIQARAREYGYLDFDTGSLEYLSEVPGHGLYLDRAWQNTLLYIQFKIMGNTFMRRAVARQLGNFAPIYVKIGGHEYSLTEHTGWKFQDHKMVKVDLLSE